MIRHAIPLRRRVLPVLLSFFSLASSFAGAGLCCRRIPIHVHLFRRMPRRPRRAGSGARFCCFVSELFLSFICNINQNRKTSLCIYKMERYLPHATTLFSHSSSAFVNPAFASWPSCTSRSSCRFVRSARWSGNTVRLMSF